MQVGVAATVTGDLREDIVSGKRSLLIKLGTGFSDWGTEDIAVLKIDKDTPRRPSYQEAIESDFVVGTAIAYREVLPYPFDDYENQFTVDVRDGTGSSYELPFTVQVIKLISGRRLVAKLDQGLANIKLARPLMQQAFVVSSGAVYILIILGISALLFMSPGKQTPQELIFASAGLLLGSVGFRDLIGLTKLSSFGAGDVLVIGIPLLFLTGALVKTAWYALSHHNVPDPAAKPKQQTP